jgi:hypothetical protein
MKAGLFDSIFDLMAAGGSIAGDDTFYGLV